MIGRYFFHNAVFMRICPAQSTGREWRLRIKRGRAKAIRLDILNCPLHQNFAGLAAAGAIRLTFGASLSLFCRMISSKKSATFWDHALGSRRD